MLNPHPTRYAELNGVLHDLVTGAQEALGESFVGAYLQGSFALGAGDLHSDCDFLVVVGERPDAEQEAALRRLHADLPHRDGFWNGHLEGSYAVADDLAHRGRAGPGVALRRPRLGRDGVVGALQPAVDPLDPARARHHARRSVPGAS